MANEMTIVNRDTIPYIGLSRPTKELIVQAIRDNQAFTEFCLIVLYCLQTPQEREVRQTIEVNGVGWNKQDGRYGPYFAEWVAYKLACDGQAAFGKAISGNVQSGAMAGRSRLELARHTIAKYGKQLERFFSFVVPDCGGFQNAWERHIVPNLPRAAKNGYLTAKKYNSSLPAPKLPDGYLN